MLPTLGKVGVDAHDLFVGDVASGSGRALLDFEGGLDPGAEGLVGQFLKSPWARERTGATRHAV